MNHSYIALLLLFLSLVACAESEEKRPSVEEAKPTPLYAIEGFSETEHRVKNQPNGHWTYKTVGEKAFKLHVFLPEGYAEAEKLPVFVVFHGGSWRTGNPDWHYPDCEYWASRGMIAVSAEYRLKEPDNVKVPLECIKDAKSVVRFLRKNAGSLKLDPDKIVVAGGSAGGHLAASVSTIDAPEINDDVYDLSISPVANVNILYNPYFKCAEELSPPFHLKDDHPATITFLGDEDPAITVESLVDYHKGILAKGGDSEFYVGLGGKHGLCNGRNPKNQFFYWSLQLTDDFLVKQGVLKENHQVVIPEKVKVLVEGEDYTSYK